MSTPTEKPVIGVEASLLAEFAPVVLDVSTPTRKAVRQMKEAHSGYVLVTEHARLCGIFTERDVLLKVLGVPGALEQPVSRWMTADPVCLDARVSVQEAIRRMREGNFRTMPIVDQDGRLRAIRHRHIIRYLVEHLRDHLLNRPPDPDREARTREGG